MEKRNSVVLTLLLTIFVVLVIIIAAVRTDFFDPVLKKDASDANNIETVVNTEENTPVTPPHEMENVQNRSVFQSVSLEEINTSYIGELVETLGVVSGKFVSQANTTFLDVKYGNGNLKVVIFDNADMDTSFISEGKMYKFQGKVDEYNGELEMIVEHRYNIIDVKQDSTTASDAKSTNQKSSEDNSAHSPSSYKYVGLEDINDSYIGKWVETVGVVTRKYVSQDNHIFMDVKDKSGMLNIVAFSSSDIEAAMIKEGQSYIIQGKVDKYNGELEIIVENMRKQGE